jgi:protein-arginine kinase
MRPLNKVKLKSKFRSKRNQNSKSQFVPLDSNQNWNKIVYHFTRHSYTPQIILILTYVLQNLKKRKEIRRKKLNGKCDH